MATNFIPDVEIRINDKVYTNFNNTISFSVRRNSKTESNTALVNISYLNKNTKSMLIKLADVPEGKTPAKITIMAGYKTDAKGIIFYGEIDKAEENSSDGVELACTEGNRGWSSEIVNKNYAPGTTLKEIVKNIMVSSSFGLGVINCKDYVYTRGFNAQGTLKSELTKLALQVNAQVSINKNKIFFVKKGYQNLTTEISADTGLKNIRKTKKGYIFVTYLNNILQENMKLKVKKHDGEIIETTITAVGHYYSRLKFETEIECFNYDDEYEDDDYGY